MRVVTTTLLLLGCTVSAFATVAAVPEIDASTGLSALTILSGGLLILRSRRGRK